MTSALEAPVELYPIGRARFLHGVVDSNRGETKTPVEYTVHCRTGHLHYHRLQIFRRMHCDKCGGEIEVAGHAWLRCQDNRPLCDGCYFPHGEQEEAEQYTLDMWRAIRNRQKKHLWT